MNLIWVIAKREFTANIFSLRLLIGLIVCLGMEKQLGNTVRVSYEEVPTGVELSKGGNPTPALFQGIDLTRVHGGLARVSSSDSNPLLNIFSHVDAIVIVQIALSLFTILIAYNVISGEREDGTLGLVMSNSVSRSQILVGKYLGGLGSILLPLAIGWIAAILLMLASSVVAFQLAEWGRLVLLFVVSALYLSAFFMLSMLVSVKVARSATALIWLLFLWVMLVLVIPNGAAYLAEEVRPIGLNAKTNADAEADRLIAELRQKVTDYGKKHQDWSYIFMDYKVVSGFYPLPNHVLTGSKEAMLWHLDGVRFYVPLSIEYAERVGNIYKEYYRSLKKQTTLAENLSRLSPGWVYYNTSAILVGTDMGRYEQFIRQARDYRKELMGYMRGQGAFSTIKWFTRADLNELPSQAVMQAEKVRISGEYNMDDLMNGKSQSREEMMRSYEGLAAYREAYQTLLSEQLKPKSWDEVEPLDLSGMPVFNFEKEGLASIIGRAWPNLAVLILLNAILFLGAMAFFMKSEVK